MDKVTILKFGSYCGRLLNIAASYKQQAASKYRKQKPENLELVRQLVTSIYFP
jgi:hypothetical protein